jgi:hypothetical protein
MQPVEGEFTHVVTMDTLHYARSPAQARLPDGVLRAGTQVRILEQVGSHVLVATENGVRGYVAGNVLACNATLKACGRAVLP